MEGSNIGFVPPNSQNNSSEQRPVLSLAMESSQLSVSPPMDEKSIASRDASVNVICISIHVVVL